MALSSGSPVADGCKSVMWVREVDGQARVRWRRALGFLASITAGTLLGMAVSGRLAYTPSNVLALVMPLCVGGAYLVLLVELQTQRLRSGRWGFRFSVRAILLWTAIAAMFLALAMNVVRDKQRGLTENQRLEQELEAVVNGGKILIGMPWGRNITCQATRPTFSDEDLERVIDLASQGGTRPCELTTLLLGGTAVTNTGVSQLCACEQLQVLNLPSIDLSDDALAALRNCSRLERLFIDDRGLTAKQLDRLRKALPKVRANHE